MENTISKNLLSFIKNSPTAFHAVSSIEKTLIREGFVQLFEAEDFKIEKGNKYYVKRNDSSIIAFKVGSDLDSYSFNIVASHSDSPMFKVKQEADINFDVYNRLNCEAYGGSILHTWLDRPLSVAGRVIVKENDKLVSKLVNFEKNIAIIPSVCIHFDREVNSGKAYNVAVDLVPLTGQKGKNFKELLAERLDCNVEDVKMYDMYLYNHQEGCFVGANDEYVSAPRLDDLQAAYTTLMGFIKSTNNHNVSVYCCFDNEEVGSTTSQGANSTFLEDILHRINSGLAYNEEDYYKAINKSFMVSADNGHALHPNHPELSDPSNKVYMNGGIIIKFNAAQSYTSDGLSASIFKEICAKAEVPTQNYANKSNIRGGGTLGNISATHVSLKLIDIGLAQLAMHSAYETSGTLDSEYMYKAIKEFYDSYLTIENGNSFNINK